MLVQRSDEPSLPSVPAPIPMITNAALSGALPLTRGTGGTGIIRPVAVALRKYLQTGCAE